MSPALLGVDVVREREEVFGIAVVVLKCHLQNEIGLLDFHVDRFVERGLGFVEVIDEGDDAALVMKDLLFLFPVVLERDRQPLVEEGQFAEPLGQHVEAELQRLENLTVRLEADLRAAAFGLSGDGQRSLGLATFIPLFEDLAVLPDFQLQPFRQGIHH